MPPLVLAFLLAQSAITKRYHKTPPLEVAFLAAHFRQLELFTIVGQLV